MSAPLVVGADLSIAKTGLALSVGELVTITPAPGVKGYDRLRPMAQAVLSRCNPADLVVIEGYDPHPRGALALIRAAELGGIVRAGLNELGVPWLEVPPSTLKKRATGKGNAGKPDVVAAAIHDGGRPANDDEADAYWLRAIGLELIAGVELLYAPIAEALAKVAETHATILHRIRESRV